MNGENLHRVPLPPQPNLPRNEMLSLINKLAVDQVIYGGSWQGAKPEGSTTTPNLVMGFTTVTFSSTLEPGVAWVVSAIPETTHMKFNKNTLKDYLLWLATIVDGLTVRRHLDLDLTEAEDKEANGAPTLT